MPFLLFFFLLLFLFEAKFFFRFFLFTAFCLSLKLVPNSLSVWVFRAIMPSNTSESPVRVYTQKKADENGRKAKRDTAPIMRNMVMISAKLSL